MRSSAFTLFTLSLLGLAAAKPIARPEALGERLAYGYVGEPHVEERSAPPLSTTPAAPSTTPRAPSTTPAAPSTTPSTSPSTTPAAPSTTPAAPSTTPAAPSTTPRAPSTTPAAPSTTPRAPSTTPAAPSTTPSTTSSTTSSTTTTPACSIPTPTCASPGPQQTYLPEPCFPNQGVCYPTNYYAAQDQGQMSISNGSFDSQMYAKCKAVCDSQSQCASFVGTENITPDGNLATGTCFLYSTQLLTPRQCADSPSRIIAYYRQAVCS